MATGTDGKLIQFDPQITTLIEDDPGRMQRQVSLLFVIVPSLGALDEAIDLSPAAKEICALILSCY